MKHSRQGRAGAGGEGPSARARQGASLRQERRARARAEAVARIIRTVASRHEPESLVQAVAPELLAVSGADRVVLCLRDPSQAALVRVADAGTPAHEEESVRALRLDLRAPALAPLAAGRPAAFAAGSRSLAASVSPFREARSVLIVPLPGREETLGAAVFAWPGRRPRLDRSFVEFLADLAGQVAMGVENARLFAALSQLASTDELTGLANRRRFAEAFRLELARTRRDGTALSLVLADVDRLKEVNDTRGHPAGDAAIRHVAAALKVGCRETDIAARLGGEEFALLLPVTDLRGAIAAAERIRRALAGSSVPGVGTVTLSLGVATFPHDGCDEQELLRKADENLYAAKAGGRNRVCPAGGGGLVGDRSSAMAMTGPRG